MLKFEIINSCPFFLPPFFLSSNILSRFVFKGPGTLDRKTSGLFQGAGRLPDQQCKFVTVAHLTLCLFFPLC